MGILVFAMAAVLIFFLFNLSGRIRRLEDLVEKGRTPPYPRTQPQQAPKTTPQPAAPPLPPLEPTAFDRFVDWLKEDWLMKLGALLLLIGFGWFASYAFLNNWIGPMGRIVLGLIAGASILALGWWRIKIHIHQGGVFLVLGSTTVLLTVFAAREIYGFFTPLSALMMMFLSCAFVAFVSVGYKNRNLALASLVLAGIAPLLTNSFGTPNYVGLFSYLLVIVLGTVWVVALIGKRELTPAALLLVSFYSAPHLALSTSADKGILLLFAYAFTAIFFITNTAGIVKLKGKNIVPDLLTAGGTGLFILAWIMYAAQEEWKSLLIAAWMIVFTVGAFLLFKATNRQEPFSVYAGVGIGMLAAATAAELQGATLVIAYTIESALIALVAYLVLKEIRIPERLTLLLAAPIVLSSESLASRAWATDVFHKDFFVLLTLAITTLGLGLLFLRPVRQAKNGESETLNTGLLVVGSLYGYALVCSHFMRPSRIMTSR